MKHMTQHPAPKLKLVESTSGNTAQTISRKSIELEQHEIQLLNKLQTTLEIEKIMSIFSVELGHVLKFNGLDYTCPVPDSIIRIGKTDQHKCSYVLKLDSKDLGSITCYRNTPFKERELNILEVLLSTLIYPLRNALMYKQAIDASFRDPLTGAQNRGAMDQTLTREIELAKRQNTPLSVILMDADYFKKINDSFGHSFGDSVLKAISQIAQETIRQSDILFRYGGEEFFIVLGQTGLEGATLLAERIRTRIAGLDNIDGKKTRITVSLGVTTLNKNDNCQSMFDRADRALYQAKAGGRNMSVSVTDYS